MKKKVRGHHGEASRKLPVAAAGRRPGGQKRLAMELRLLQAQRFQALNQLASGVAHEFNNLLAGILGSAEMLGLELPEGQPGRESLRQIFEASNRASKFAYQLRAFGQRPPPEFRPTRLQPVLEDCLQVLRTALPAGVELQVRIDPDCPEVNADATQIHQAILDLCLQAGQGLPEARGRIEIALENCPMACPPAGVRSRMKAGPHVCLTVKDNSPGLEASVREQSFQPFRNLRASGTKAGLELFHVRETIQGHEGDIFLESEPGCGMTFRIYLPVA